MAKKAKAKVEDNTISGIAENILDVLNDAADKGEAPQKPYEITSASVKEQKCNYGYEIKTGPTAGDKIPTRKGEAIIHEDMQNAFNALKVHLAIADDAFKHVFKELPELKILQSHEITQGFTVYGFKVSGNDEDEGYMLVGEKWVTLGIMGVDTPKISSGSNYKYWDDLKESIAIVRGEVEEYMNGKHEIDEEDNQPELPFDAGKTSADEFDDEE